MMLIKPGAKIAKIQPEILLGIEIVRAVLDRYGYDCIITEGTGGKHLSRSRHYVGLAVDIRSKHIKTAVEKYQILDKAAECLGDDFDFILEMPGKENEHYHLEFDPQ